MARITSATRLAALPTPKRVPARNATRRYASAATATSSRAGGGQTLADQYASQESGRWKGTDTTGGSTKLFVGGQFVESKADRWIDVNDPSTQKVLTRVPEPTKAELTATVDAAEAAFREWSLSSVLSRQKIMLNLQDLLRKYQDDIARSIVLEQGKTLPDAKGDVLRGIQVVEAACALPQLTMGEKLEVSKDMDTETRKVPLGVTAAICPFNFPAMIPLWSVLSVAMGNSLIIKPSERDPGASMIIAELAERAGMPSGVLSVTHGSVDTVNFLCDEPRIKAISFVGSDRAGTYIYNRATGNGKRVQANLGAKNHCVVMPDASPNLALNSIAGAAFGAAGQRCMALSVMVTVGGAKDWVPELIERAKALKVGNGFEEGAELGPVITPAAKARIEELIGSAEKEGGKILLDGRGQTVDGYPNGNWIGPTVIQAKPGMSCYENEIFGPCLTVLNVDTLDEAIELINRNRYGNGTAIFTRDGAAARRFEREVEAGQIGVNIPVPVPLPMFAWSGNKGSVLGGHSLYGKLGVDFWTQMKTTTTLWRASDAVGNRADVSMPTHR